MPAYQTTPFKEPMKLAIAGQPTYLFGSYNDRTGNTRGYIISDSAVTTTGTVTFQIVAGNPPIVGALISVRGAGRSANLNVTNATILTVVTDMNTGVCTVTYAISSTTLATGADSGEVAVPQPEIGEALVNGASIPVAVSFAPGNTNQDRAITVVVSFPSLPTTAVVTLEQAVIDLNSEYDEAVAVATVAGGVVTVGGQITVDPALGRFFRINVASVTGGTNPTIIAKLLT